MSTYHQFYKDKKLILQFKKPERPYKNFDQYMQKVRTDYWNKTKSDYPCLNCLGEGFVYDPNDPPCPVEGNKLRNVIHCPTCKGTGSTLKAVHEYVYKNAISEWEKRAKEFNTKCAIMKNALAKLTLEECLTLRLPSDGESYQSCVKQPSKYIKVHL